ncbi:MAG: hypothetical protein JWM91_2458 [Rhodospirillales bacterium]|nr:hypothetical protein [Rhodospirillales bacterium]
MLVRFTNVDAETSHLSVCSALCRNRPEERSVSRVMGVTIMALFWGGVAFAVAAAMALMAALCWAIFSVVIPDRPLLLVCLLLGELARYQAERQRF